MSLRHKKLVISLGSAVLLLLVLLAFFSRTSISHQLHTWKLLPEPEHLTELYFTDHNQVPRKYTPGQPQTVAISIHNVEYRTMNYSYAVTQSSADGSQPLTMASGTVTLPQDRTQNLTLAITPADLGLRSKLTIQLRSGESISYWVNKEGA